jgi:hypothetical protein
MVFYLLNLLASVTHVLLALGARLYQRCRAQESRRELWAVLRTTLTILLVESWTHLLRVKIGTRSAGHVRRSLAFLVSQ